MNSFVWLDILVVLPKSKIIHTIHKLKLDQRFKGGVGMR